MYRLFAALPVPEDLHDGLLALQDDLPGASWRPAENFHITLRFFGDLSHAEARDLDELLGEIRCRPFEISLEGTGWFGRREPTAVWARVRESDELRSLSAQCERAARRLGLDPDRRPFTPHVTLAYLRHTELDRVLAFERRCALFSTPAFTVDRFYLYSSHTRDNAPSQYVIEAEYPLG